MKKKILPVKLFCGILFREDPDLTRVIRSLEKRFGPVEDRSPPVDFVQTDYYEEEMGHGLKRLFVSFLKLASRERIVPAKLFTNSVEERFLSRTGGRRVNLDPGFISLANVALATTKDFQHRVWLGRGIYLENTLRFRRGRWTAWEWTYPDYLTPSSLEWFQMVHDRYKKSLTDRR